MPVLNSDIALNLDKIANLLEIQGGNPFRVRAYRNASRTVAQLPHSVTSMLAAGEDLAELPGIGNDLAGKISSLAKTGHLALLDQMERRLPAGLVALLGVGGLGPKRVQLLHKKLGIGDPAALAVAIKAGKLKKLRGFGPKTEQKILAALALPASAKRTKRPIAEEVAEALLKYLRAIPGVGVVAVAGSYRRRQETVGDLDILMTAVRPDRAITAFAGYEDVVAVLAKGTTRASVRLRNGLQIDLRVVPEVCYGAALVYFTGSKPHNIALRQRAAARGLKLSEYGLYRGARRVAGKTERDVYARLGLPFIEPELREARGEIEAAELGKLPRLVELSDLRGDLHVHSTASDGRASIAELVQAARGRGLDYLAITEHSRRLTIAHGLDPRRLAAQTQAIDRLNESLRGFRVLKSIEVDILEDGRLDLPDADLDRLDLVVCAVHSGFDLRRAKQTERVLRAMDNRRVTILAHPTGRLINERPAYDIDIERVMHGAVDRGCFVEVNAQPDRLDLTDIQCRLAKEIGLKVAISSDAHSTAELRYLRFGVDQARRGWLEPDDVLNTRPWTTLRTLIRR